MAQDNEMKSISRFLSFVLRHEPQSIGLMLDEAGWASVDELLAKAQAAGKRLDRSR
jgi:putative RNA 2'-phosphotransferase